MPAVSTLSSSGARRSSSVASGDHNKPSEEVIRALVQRNVSEVKSSFLVFKSQVRGLLEAQSRVALDLERQLGARLLRSEQERLMYKQMLHHLRGSIRVFCRVRPLLPDIDPRPSAADVTSTSNGHLSSSGDEYLKFVSEKQLELNPSAAAAARHLATTSTSTSSAENKKVFFFDRIFAPDRADANAELYAAVSEEILAAFDGQNVALIAYGATGTGKTYSCNSIMERAIKEIDSMWKRASAAGERMDIEAQLVEVYNESIQDLLGCGGGSASSGSGGAPAGSASTTAVGGLKVQDVTLSVAAGAAASAAGGGGVATITRTEVVGARKLKLDNSRIQSSLAHILKLGHENRATFATNVHEHSSRSHLVLTLWISTYVKDAAPPIISASGSASTSTSTASRGHLQLLKCGKLSFVDLAGSERVKKSDVSGDRLKEAQYINKSLSALQDVIWAHERKIAHIPYRNSKLTHLLQDSLGNGTQSRTVILVTLSPAAAHVKESLQTLQFGSRLNSVNFSAASKRGAESVEQNRLKGILQEERKEKTMVKNAAEKLRREAEVKEIALREKDDMIAALKEQVHQLENALKGRPKGSLNFTTPLQFTARGSGSAEAKSGSPVLQPKFVSPAMGAGLGLPPGGALGASCLSGSNGSATQSPPAPGGAGGSRQQFNGGAPRLQLVNVVTSGRCTPAFPSSSSSSSHVTQSGSSPQDAGSTADATAQLIRSREHGDIEQLQQQELNSLQTNAARVSGIRPSPREAGTGGGAGGPSPSNFRAAVVARNTIGVVPRAVGRGTATAGADAAASSSSRRPVESSAYGSNLVVEQQAPPRAKSSSPIKVSPRYQTRGAPPGAGSSALATATNNPPLRVGGVFTPRIVAEPGGGGSSSSSAAAPGTRANATQPTTSTTSKYFYPRMQPQAVIAASTSSAIDSGRGNAAARPQSPQFHFYHGTTPAAGTAPMSPILTDGFHTARGAFSSGIGAPGASPSASPQSHQGAARTSGQQPPQADGFFTARDPLPVKTPIRGQTSSVARSSISSASATRRTPQQPRYYQVEAISSQEARELVKEWGREGEAADGDGSPPLVLKEAPDVGREHLTFDHLEPEDQDGGAACNRDGLVLEPQEELEETPGGNNGRSSTSRRTIPSGAGAGKGDGQQMRTVNLLDAGAPYGDRDDDMDAVSLSSTESDIKERLQFLLDIDPRSKADDSRTSDASCRPEQEVDRNSGCTGSGAVDYEVGKLHAQRGHPVQVAASPLGVGSVTLNAAALVGGRNQRASPNVVLQSHGLATPGLPRPDFTNKLQARPPMSTRVDAAAPSPFYNERLTVSAASAGAAQAQPSRSATQRPPHQGSAPPGASAYYGSYLASAPSPSGTAGSAADRPRPNTQPPQTGAAFAHSRPTGAASSSSATRASSTSAGKQTQHHGGATATTAAAAFYNFGTGAGTGASTGVTPGSRTETPGGNVIGTTGGNNTPTPLFGAYPKIHVPGFSQLNYAPRVPQTARTTWK